MICCSSITWHVRLGKWILSKSLKRNHVINNVLNYIFRVGKLNIQTHTLPN